MLSLNIKYYVRTKFNIIIFSIFRDPTIVQAVTKISNFQKIFDFLFFYKKGNLKSQKNILEISSLLIFVGRFQMLLALVFCFKVRI